jgi:hypothetical protein
MKAIVLLFCLFSVGQAFSADQSVPQAANASELRFRKTARAHVEDMISSGHAAELIVKGLDKAFAEAERQLVKKGFTNEAENLNAEWNGAYRAIIADVPQDGVMGDMGDHEAELVSKWLNDKYLMLEAKLGVNIMELTHLRDIWVMNNGIKVTFQPHFDSNWCAETIETDPTDQCDLEYSRHFAGTKWVPEHDPAHEDVVKHHGTVPVASYWVALAACEAALWGSDGTFLCGSAATGVEYLVEHFVAQKAAAKVWTHYNP